MYKNHHELINLLKKEKLFANKDLGQNFLVNFNVIKKIIRTAELERDDLIVEVGPGLGVLTTELAKHVKKVRTIEVDRALFPYLEKEFTGIPNIELEKGNALKAELPATNYKLVANIPYNITSPLLTHFLQPQGQKNNPQQKRPELIVLLVQKELAEKVCEKDGKHSILSLQTQIFGEPSIVGQVPKTDFYPQPKVDSAILKIEVYKSPLIQHPEIFHQLISAAFHQKRKTLQNSLKSTPYKDIPAHLENAKIDPNRRPQTLSIEEWNALVTSIQKTNLYP